MRTLIEHLDDTQVEILESYMSFRRVPQGAILQQFKTNKHLYFIKTGRIEICRRLRIDNQDITIHLHSLEAPHILSEATLMKDRHEDFIILSSTPCDFFELTEGSLKELKREHPDIAFILLEHVGTTLANRLYELQERIMERMAHKTQNVDLTVQLMNRFVGNAMQCSKSMQEKLFDQFNDDVAKESQSTKFLDIKIMPQ